MDTDGTVTKAAHPATVLVLDEVRREREAQDERWGIQRRPSLDSVLLHRPGGCDQRRIAEHYEIPSEGRAKFLCEQAFEEGQGTWAHVLVEEVSETVGCLTDEGAMRRELLQVAAVAVAWIEDIDRRNPPT